MSLTFQGNPCRNGHSGLRYVKTKDCVDCSKARATRWNNNNKEKRKKSNLKAGRKKRNLPEPTRPCPDTCEACGSKDQLGRNLCLDHDHISGKFRGWLCTHCNVGFGMLGDSLESITSRLNYLIKLKTENR